MADCAAASITIGGIVTEAEFITLCRLIAAEDLSVGEDGDPFSPADRTAGEPLRLFDHQAIGGHFESLGAWCFEPALPFSRWCAASPGDRKSVTWGKSVQARVVPGGRLFNKKKDQQATQPTN